MLFVAADLLQMWVEKREPTQTYTCMIVCNIFVAVYVCVCVCSISLCKRYNCNFYEQRAASKPQQAIISVYRIAGKKQKDDLITEGVKIQDCLPLSVLYSAKCVGKG